MPKKKTSEWYDTIAREEGRLTGMAKDWDRVRDMLMNRVLSKKDRTELLYENLFFSISRIILPSIYFRNPHVLCKPGRTDVPAAYARINELLLNYQLEHMDFDAEARNVIHDALFTPVGIAKLGFAPALFDYEGTEVAELFAKEDRKGTFDERVYDERITEKIPFIVRVSPRQFLIDPLATSLADARWACFVVLRPVEEVKRNGHYLQSVSKDIEGTHSLGERFYNEAESAPRLDPPSRRTTQELVKIYEIWDKETNKIITLDSYHMKNRHETPLRQDENPYEMDSFPAEILRFNVSPDEFYGPCDALTWEPLIEAHMHMITMQFQHVRRFNRKYLKKKGVLDEGQDMMLKLPEDGAIVEVNGEVDDIVPLQDAPITPDLYLLRDYIRLSLNTMSGTTEQRKGVSERSKTATEASIIEAQARVRDSDRVVQISKWVQKLARKLHMLNRKYLSPEDVTFLTGEPWLDKTSMVGYDLSKMWDEKSQEVLDAEIEIKVRVGTSSFMSKEIRIKQLLDFWNLTANVVDPATGTPVINHRALLERIADAMEIDDVDELLQPQGMAAFPPQGSPGLQQPDRRLGGDNAIGDLLSGVQNMGIGRQANPTALSREGSKGG